MSAPVSRLAQAAIVHVALTMWPEIGFFSFFHEIITEPRSKISRLHRCLRKNQTCERRAVLSFSSLVSL